VMIISIDHIILNIERDLDKLSAFFIKYKIYAGISSGFQDLFELRKYYREAINALNYGLGGMRDQQIFRYDNTRVEHFLNSIKNNVNISEIYSPIIFLILKYDKENNTSLLKLLYIYLLYGKDIPLTCEKIEITRDKLNSELKKLEDIFGIDWKNGNMLFNLFISIEMFESLPLVIKGR